MAKRKRRNVTPEFKAEVVIEALSGESSQAELCRCHNLSEEQLSTWKRQLIENAASLFESRDKSSKETTERIAHLEQLVGQADRGSGHPRESLKLVERNGSEKRQIVEVLATDSSVRQIG